MHDCGDVQNMARQIIYDRTEEMETRANDFAFWLVDAEQGGGINGREADQLRQRIISALQEPERD